MTSSEIEAFLKTLKKGEYLPIRRGKSPIKSIVSRARARGHEKIYVVAKEKGRYAISALKIQANGSYKWVG